MTYKKTELGQSALQRRSVALNPRQRAAFIMFDGKREISEVMSAMAGLGVTPDDVTHLVSLGLLEAHAEARTSPIPVGVLASTAIGGTQLTTVLSHTADGFHSLSAQAQYLKAISVATRLTADLGLRGFRLNLAVEATDSLDQLKQLAPKIREAIGPEKFLELENALYH